MRGCRRPFFSFKRDLSIHEYQSQRLLAEHGIPVPKGRLAHNASNVRRAVEWLGGSGVVKAQVISSGRGNGTFQDGFKSGIHVVTW